EGFGEPGLGIGVPAGRDLHRGVLLDQLAVEQHADGKLERGGITQVELIDAGLGYADLVLGKAGHLALVGDDADALAIVGLVYQGAAAPERLGLEQDAAGGGGAARRQRRLEAAPGLAQALPLLAGRQVVRRAPPRRLHQRLADQLDLLVDLRAHLRDLLLVLPA